jgi:uncharacterized protein
MLIEFRVENHRSIRDEQVLSMEAAQLGDENDPRPRIVPGWPEKILPVAAIYGANASGKSNVLAALAFMQEAVTDSQRAWSPDEGIPREPFAWGEKRTGPSTFEVSFILGTIRYDYGFTLNDGIFLEEWLKAWADGEPESLFAREEDSYTFGKNLGGENKVIEGVTRPNALFLSAAAQLKHPQLSSLFSWFSSVEAIGLPARRTPSVLVRSESTLAYLLEQAEATATRPLFKDELGLESLLDGFISLLKNADIGIVDVRKKEQTRPSRVRPWQFELKHQSEGDDAWLPLEEESKGTRTLFRLALPILRTIRYGGILLVDEQESSMHPNLAEGIVRQFNDPKINKSNAQLIFSTHDTNLLGNLTGTPALRRDQVWLTEKDPKGATELYPLTNFKPREGTENIERGYIQGRYGAIPFLGGFNILGE